MVKRNMNCSDEEPQNKTFELPSVGLHSFRVVDVKENENDPNLVLVKLEVCDGAEMGRSILHRVNLDTEFKGFFFTRLFLKALAEPYKGSFDVDSDMWLGKTFSATIKHSLSADKTKTYANLDKFEFDIPATVGTPFAEQPKEVAWEE
jgi:hypothetical protein